MVYRDQRSHANFFRRTRFSSAERWEDGGDKTAGARKRRERDKRERDREKKEKKKKKKKRRGGRGEERDERETLTCFSVVANTAIANCGDPTVASAVYSLAQPHCALTLRHLPR